MAKLVVVNNAPEIMVDSLFDTIAQLQKELYTFLKICKVEVRPDLPLKCYIEKLKEVVVIREDKNYLGVTLNNGYIKSSQLIEGVIENENVPEDINRGYYLYENGKFKLDAKMRQKLWG